MSAIIAERAFAQQKNFCESPVKPHLSGKLREGVTKWVRVGFEFTPVPEFIEREIETPALEKLYRIIMRMVRRGNSDPSLRVLAKAMGRSLRMVQRYIRALVRLGKLIVQERRITRDRNATNVYILPDLQKGVGDKNVTEKKGEVLKTTTAAPERAAGKSELHKLYEARLAQDRADSKWRKALHERAVAAREKLAGFWSHKKEEKSRKISENEIGSSRWYGPEEELTLPDWQREMLAEMKGKA